VNIEINVAKWALTQKNVKMIKIKMVEPKTRSAFSVGSWWGHLLDLRVILDPS
jgi:hypothetical protein